MRKLLALASGLFTVATFGVGLILVILFYVLGFWLIPAIQLQVFAALFPEQFAVAGWLSAIWAGLLVMFVNIITGVGGPGAKLSVQRSQPCMVCGLKIGTAATPPTATASGGTKPQI